MQTFHVYTTEKVEAFDTSINLYVTQIREPVCAKSLRGELWIVILKQNNKGEGINYHLTFYCKTLEEAAVSCAVE